MSFRSRIIGVGSYLPTDVWTNERLTSIMDTSDEWIVQRTGIKERRWAAEGEGTSDLALKATEEAVRMAGIKKEEIEMIIFATLSPDHDFPGSGCFLQAKLGLPGIPAIDVRQQCTGFIYGLSIADQFIRTGTYKKVLVVGAEVHSRGLDRTTKGRDVAVLFGDGAGAVILSAEKITDEKAPGILSTHIHADGSFAKELWVPAPGMSLPGTARLSHELIDDGSIYPQMNGKTVFVHAVTRMPESVQEALGANGLTLDQVDLFVFHQANLRINEMVAKKLRIPEEKVFNTIEKTANTTAATIPIGLDLAVKAGKLKPGMIVASAAFGSGFTWGSTIIRWG